MTMLRFAASIVRLYPRAWRVRYEDEILALLDERPPTFRHVVDLASGATWEWVQTSETFRRRAALAWALVCWSIGAGAVSWPFAGLGVDGAFAAGVGCVISLQLLILAVERRRSAERRRTHRPATIALPSHWLVVLGVTSVLSIGVGLQFWAKASGALAGTNPKIFSLSLLVHCFVATASILGHWTRRDDRVAGRRCASDQADHAPTRPDLSNFDPRLRSGRPELVEGRTSNFWLCTSNFPGPWALGPGPVYDLYCPEALQ